MKDTRKFGSQKQLAVLIVALTMGATSLLNAPSLSAQNMDNKNPDKDLMDLKHQKDSLVNANCDMFNAAQDKYYERLDKKYTMRLFFSRRELKELNKALDPYFQAFAKKNSLSGETSIEYEYIKLIFPIKPDMPFGKLPYILRKLNVPGEVVAPFDVISDQGHIYAFNDKNKQNNFECFNEAFALGFMTEDGPDCEISEFEKICDEWHANEQKIANLKNEMMNVNVK